MKKRSPSIEKTAETRRKIILAALHEFNALGFAQSKIATIAIHAGLGKGTIYSYFETKEKLFEAVIDYLIQDTYHQIQSNELKDNQTVAQFILEQMLVGIENIESAGRANIARLILSEGKYFSDIRDLYIQKIYQPGLDELGKLIRIAIERKELSKDANPEVLAVLIIAPIWMGMIHNGVLAPLDLVSIRTLFQTNIAHIFKL